MNLHPTLASNIKTKEKEWREFVARQMKAMRANAQILSNSATKLDAAGFEWFAGDDKIYVTVPAPQGERNKAAFSTAVKRIASILGESPDIRVEPKEYMAEFKDSRVHVYLNGAEDCKLIELTETKTVTVLKPHPACKAALTELEQLA